MKRIAASILAGAGLLALAAAAPAGAQDGALPEISLRPDADLRADADAAGMSGEAVPLEGEAAREALSRASAWLNGVTGLQGRFQQLNADGSLVEGDLYIHRPGRLRFAYDAPSPLTIVADGRTVAVIDSDLDTVDRTLLEETPLSWLLKSNVDLARDAGMRGVARQDGLVMVSIDDPGDQIPGQLVLIFSDPEFALREWVAIDEYGQQTRVTLYDVRRQASLDPSLFTYELNSGPRRPGGR